MNKDVLSILKDRNVKLTSDRRRIISILEKTRLPLTPNDIYLRLIGDSHNTNLTTVYRNLELLEGLGLVKRLGFNKNSFYYELLSDRTHHHHAICQSCGKVEDLENISEKFVQELEKSTKFKIEDHNLEFFGLCQECQKNGFTNG